MEECRRDVEIVGFLIGETQTRDSRTPMAVTLSFTHHYGVTAGVTARLGLFQIGGSDDRTQMPL